MYPSVAQFQHGGRFVKSLYLPRILLRALQDNSARFPILARIARDHLPVQGSSVASERVFSSAGLDDDKRRGKTAANTFGCLQFVKAHCKERRHREVLAEKIANDAQKAAWTSG